MGPDQLFGVIVLSHGGVDLESFDFDATFGWQQALSILRQVVAALADAETTAEFEVRCVGSMDRAMAHAFLSSIATCTKVKSSFGLIHPTKRLQRVP